MITRDDFPEEETRRAFSARFGACAQPSQVSDAPDFDWLSATITRESRAELNERLARIPALLDAHERDILEPYNIDRNVLANYAPSAAIRQRLKDIDTCEAHARKTARAVRSALHRHYELEIWLEIWLRENPQ